MSLKILGQFLKKRLSHFHTICRQDARGEEGGQRGSDLLPGHTRNPREAHPVRQPGCKKIAQQESLTNLFNNETV
jgi:hypothetical protein